MLTHFDHAFERGDSPFTKATHGLTEQDMEPLTCSIADAAKALGVSRATLYHRMNDGHIESVKLGGRRLVKIASVKQLVGAAA